MLSALLGVDLILIVVHVGNSLVLARENPLLDITRDASIPEFFQYFKFLGVAILLALTALRRDRGLAPWALLYVYLLLDDSLRFHESGGAAIARVIDALHPSWLPQVARLRSQDYGELLASAVAGVVLFGLIAAAFWKGSPGHRREASALLVLTMALVGFGVGVDIGKRCFTLGRQGLFLGGILEDGGEMVVASSVLSLSYVIWRRRPVAEPPVRDLATIAV